MTIVGQRQMQSCLRSPSKLFNVLSTLQMAAEEVGWGDDEDDTASPTATGPPAAVPGPALAATAAAAATSLPAVSPSEKQSEPGTAIAGLPAVSEAADASQSDTVAEPTAVDRHPAPEPDEVATASDSTDGGAGGGERWTVVSTGTPTKASAAAAAALPLDSDSDAAAVAGDAATAQVPATSLQTSSPVTGDAVSAAGTATSKSPAEAAAAASPSTAAKPPQKPVAAVADDDDDDDLADVEVPEGGDGSEVDEDWGAQLLEEVRHRRTAQLYTASVAPLWSELDLLFVSRLAVSWLDKYLLVTQVAGVLRTKTEHATVQQLLGL